MEDLTGKQFGSYQIVAPLGEGGMAAVYKAIQPSMERFVAIKVLPKHMTASEEFLTRFKREARLLAQLQHPHILPVFDYGESDGYPYIVMPFVPSGTLAGLLKDRRLSLQEVRRMMTQVGDALGYAHGHGMIHRDIKPSNVLIDERGNCLLTDFGLARMAETTTKITTTGTIMGTPAYMSPEQGSGAEIDHRSDLYSLGIILYEMVTGRVPYIAETPVAVVFKHIQDPLPPASKFNPSLPEEVELVLFKTLAKNPDDRYQTADDFVRAIQKAIPETLIVEQVPTLIQTPLETTVLSQPQPQAAPTEKPKPRAGIAKYGLFAAGVLFVIIAGILEISYFARQTRPTEAVVIAPSQQKQSPSSTQAIPTNLPVPALIPPSELNCRKPETFCVGLVTDVGHVNDKSFHQSAWEGVLLAEKELGAHVQYIETSDSKDYAKNIAVFGDAGYDVIVTVGFNLAEATDAAGIQYPDSKFIGVDQYQPGLVPNVAGLVFPEDQAGFLVGALAAMMSELHKIGAVCGSDAIPAVWRFGEGYRAGAAHADQIIGTATDVLVVYHNDVEFDKTFNDPEWGAVTAKSMLDQGVDIIFGCGGLTGNGAITAAAQAGRYVIGVDTDQYFTLPEAAPRMLSSAIKDIQPGVFDLIIAAKSNNFPAGNRGGPVGYAPYHELEDKVPPEVRTKMEEILRGLRDGSIKTNLPLECPDPLGCVTIAPGEPVHIAYGLVVAGPNQTLGIDSRNGVEIAIDDARGKILGHSIKFDGQDTGCSEATGRAAAAKLAADPTIVAVIGPSCSSETRVGMSILSKAGFVVISPSNTAPDLTEANNPNNRPGYLRTSYNDKIQGAMAAGYVFNELGIKTAATIRDDSIYADRLQQTFTDNFKQLGGTITSQLVITPNGKNFSRVLVDIASGKPELIYMPIFQPAGPLIIQQAKKTSGLENVRLMGADGLFSPDVVTAAGNDIEGFLLSSPFVTGAAYDAFVGKYETKFGKAPLSVFHAHAYDAFNIVKTAIEKVAIQQPDGTLLIPRQALRDAMYSTSNFQGLTGTLSCTPTGDCANPVVGIYEYHKGEYPPTLIFPK